MKPQSSDAKPLAISQGDPAGVGPQASLLAWFALREQTQHSFYLRASTRQLRQVSEQFGLDVPIREISSPEEVFACFADALPVLPIADAITASPGKPDIATAPAIIGSIADCVDDVWTGKADAIVTNPIAKSLLYASGFKHPGHTEYLAHLVGQYTGAEPPLPIMMLVGGGLRVALATIHIPLMSVANQLSSDHLEQVSEIVCASLANDFGITAPRLGVCGLNPHAGEGGTIGFEDESLIRPAINALCTKGLNVIGPRPGDTIFYEALSGRYDAVLAMYHDQGLIPVKTLDVWGGVNVTLGLPFVRTSPDHGTGYDVAETGKVRADSLIAAIRLAREMADNRRAARQKHD